jgi:hypothetical protein
MEKNSPHSSEYPIIREELHRLKGLINPDVTFEWQYRCMSDLLPIGCYYSEHDRKWIVSYPFGSMRECLPVILQTLKEKLSEEHRFDGVIVVDESLCSP